MNSTFSPRKVGFISWNRPFFVKYKTEIKENLQYV
nr:MAG TPA: hypothetical protein [Bacteriophage sp.]